MTGPGGKGRDGDEPGSFEEIAGASGDIEPMEDRHRMVRGTQGPPDPGNEPAPQSAGGGKTNDGFRRPDPGEPLKARRSGVGRGLFKRFCRGDMPIGSTLDLHGLRFEAARNRVQNGLARAAGAGEQCVLVVTGQGLHSEGGVARLRKALPGWLADPTLAAPVVAFAPAQKRHGGAGAVYVLLG